ncbi:MAG: tyrosine-protein phosphatase [Clostridia bacterium]|nr:tyrosine-protein phosphatase [Clostridia bacterium]
MKKFRTVAVATACIIMATVASFSACNSSPIKLENYDTPLDFHTPDQLSYMQGDYEAIAAYAHGVEEKSRPNCITLKWTDSSSSDQYKVEISEFADYSNALTYVVEETEVSVYNLKIATNYYWRVTTEETSAMGTFKTSDVGPRNIYVEGVTNVRDMGGRMTSYGKRMVQGILYRGARLNKSDVNDDGYKTAPQEFVPEITENGIDVFVNQLKIKTEIDIRLLTRNGYPADKPAESTVPGLQYLRIPMNGNSAIGDNAEKVKEFMELLADKNNYPIYYHCNIGTDRTGMLSYLIGGLCGMSEEDLMKDYLFSNFGNIGEAKEPHNSKNKYVELLSAEGDYEGATLRERIENYFISIGVSAETYTAVRDILLGN